MRARYGGRCGRCGRAIQVGDEITYPPAAHARCSAGAGRRASRSDRVDASPVGSLDDAAITAALAAEGRSLVEGAGRRSWTSATVDALGSVVTISGRHFLVTATGASYYHSEEECEDNDCFCGQYGEKYPASGPEVTESAAEAAARAAAVELREAARLERERRDAHLAELTSAPAGWLFVDGAAIGGDWSITGNGDTARGTEVPLSIPPRETWQLLDHEEGRQDSRYARRYNAGSFVVVEHGNADDWRVAVIVPPELRPAYLAAEVARQGITPEAARAWLEQYRGCVGSEIYEYAAEDRGA